MKRLALLIIAVVFGCGFSCQNPASQLQITTQTLPSADLGVAYIAKFEAAGGLPPYVWSVAAGALPPGLELNAGGELAGVPLQSGVYDFAVRVADSASGHALLLINIEAHPIDPARLHPALLKVSLQTPRPCRKGPKTADSVGTVITGCGGGEIQGGVTLTIQGAAPTISGVSPDFGPTTGGTAITISGTNFQTGATVTVGGGSCGSVVVVTANQITCVTPAGSAGLADIVVTNPDLGTVLRASAFDYGASSPPEPSGPPLAANNTSACGGSPLQAYCSASFPGMTDTTDSGVATALFNPPPGNVSKINIHNYLPAGTVALVHLMGWFTQATSGDHIQTKYASNNTATVTGQMTDIESRGWDGVVIDWYSQLDSTVDGFTKKVRDNLAASGLMKFAIMEDQGAVFHSGDHNCAPGDHACIVSAWETDLCYANANYFTSPAYLNINPSTQQKVASGHPTVFTFPPSAGWDTTDLSTVETFAQNLALNCTGTGAGINNGPVNFINQDSAGFSAPWDGAFSWVSTSTYSLTNQFLIDGASGNYHEAFYSDCNTNSSKICVGSAKKGFNDTRASWGLDRVVDQECAQTWITTLGKTSSYSGAHLFLQGVTWNDYEEGTEIESGIDNCYSVNTISLVGSTLGYSAATSNSTYAAAPSGVPTNGTVDNWTIWGCVAGTNNCSDWAHEPPSTLSLDLSTLTIPSGTYDVYVQLVGKNSIFNHLSPNHVSYTSAAPTSCSGPFSESSQEPITCVPHAGTIADHRLPADVMSHLYAGGDAIAQQSLLACAPGRCTATMTLAHSGSQNDINGVPRYYGNASDPAYYFSTGNTPISPYNALGTGNAFHAPNRAQTSGASSEHYFEVWDQVQNKYFFLYKYTAATGSSTYVFPACSSTSLTAPCNSGAPASDVSKNARNEAKPYGVLLGNGFASIGLLPDFGLIRVQELIQGHIYHPLYLNVLCEANNPSNPAAAAVVFPDTGTFAAQSCSHVSGATNVSTPPPGGALIFLDYTDAQLATLAGMLPAWQYPIIEALTHYGGYVGDTGNPLHPSRMESDDAYNTAGITNPLWGWLNGQAGLNAGCGTGTTQCNLDWSNLNRGGSCTDSSVCIIANHIHMADPCIAKGMAGLSAGAGACF